MACKDELCSERHPTPGTSELAGVLRCEAPVTGLVREEAEALNVEESGGSALTAWLGWFEHCPDMPML